MAALENLQHLLFICMVVVRLRTRDYNGWYNDPSRSDECWFSPLINHIWVHVCLFETDRLAEGDGCVSVQGMMNALRVQVESRFAFSVLAKVYAEFLRW